MHTLYFAADARCTVPCDVPRSQGGDAVRTSSGPKRSFSSGTSAACFVTATAISCPFWIKKKKKKPLCACTFNPGLIALLPFSPQLDCLSSRPCFVALNRDFAFCSPGAPTSRKIYYGMRLSSAPEVLFCLRGFYSIFPFRHLLLLCGLCLARYIFRNGVGSVLAGASRTCTVGCQR